MSKPKISIVTPSYNQGQFIEETILSIINQNYQNFEYIIIDGASSDNTLQIIKKYEDYLAYWVSEKDDGQSHAINKGFKKATGDILCWINSDDMLMPDALNKVANYFQNNKEMDLLNGYTLILNENSTIKFNYFILKQKKCYAKRGIYYLSQPSMFWKRNVFESIGLLNEDFHAAMDQEFLIRVFKNDVRIGHLGKILSAFRVHNSSKSSVNGIIWSRDRLELLNLYGDEYRQTPMILYTYVYRIEKLFKMLYFKHWFFKHKWKGRCVNELNTRNCKYL